MGRKKLREINNLKIERMAAEGKAMGYHNEKVVFVPNVAPGDVVNIRVTQQRKKFYEGYPTEVLSRGELYQEPFCPHFAHCGGCKWQHVPYSEQLAFKQQQVLDALDRLAKVERPEPLPILGCENTQEYRNKLEFTFANRRWLTPEEIKQDKEFAEGALGFHVPKRFDKIIDIESCSLMPNLQNKIRNGLRDFVQAEGISFYDIKAHTGALRNLIFRSSNTGDFMVIVQLAYATEEEVEKVMNFLKTSFPEITSLMYILNTKKNETFHDQEVHLFSGEAFITEKMEDLHFRIGPKSFFQTNSEQALALYKVAREFAGLTGEENVFDLYTGTGTIAQFVAHQAKQVLGIEYVEAAVEDARKNAERNGIANCEFIAGDMKDILTEEFLAERPRPDVVITDPPRAGMHEDVVKALLALRAPKIVYVSCNPATQARDIALLDEAYSLEKIQTVDMFPHTHHVENVVLLRLKK